MKPYYFLGACVLAVAILVPLGAPIGTVVGGIMVAALFSMMLSKPKGTALAKLKRQK
jgi:hypothetical protein